jgi:DNA ligase-1
MKKCEMIEKNSNMKTEKGNEMTTLYHKNKNGKMVQWRIWTEGANILTEYGQVNGKMQTSRKTAIGKNTGKVNETSPEEQAEMEAKAMHKHRLERKYSASIEEADKGIFLPMLATDFEKRKDKIEYPVDVQPKLDGVRCLAFWEGDSVKLMSRNGKTWEHCGHIADELETCLPKGWVVDGELYVHGKTFQEVTSYVKKFRDETLEVKLHLYDVASIGDGVEYVWEERREQLADFATNEFDAVKFCRCDVAKDEAEVYELQSKYLEDGYEGGIVRLEEGKYVLGYRSNKLLKVKKFLDNEYKVVNYIDGKGRFEGCCIWICVTEAGQEFKVVSQGTMEERKEMYDNGDDYIGEWLKVKYFEFTDDGIPRFPVGIGFRLEQDM